VLNFQFLTRKNPIRDENNSFRFKREEHLKGRKEIREVFNKGRWFNCQGAKLFVLKNSLPYNRICFTFSRFSGKKSNKSDKSNKSCFSWNAVSRNRARRLGREAFRLLKPSLIGGYDLILLVHPEPRTVLSCRMGQLESLFTKAGLFK